MTDEANEEAKLRDLILVPIEMFIQQCFDGQLTKDEAFDKIATYVVTCASRHMPYSYWKEPSITEPRIISVGPR